MKKLFAFALAFMFILSLPVLAEDGVESDTVEISAENFGDCVSSTTAEQLTWGEGTVQAVNIPLFGLKLPKPIALGDTVVIHIKGTSAGDFRVWLLGEAEKTFSNQYKMSDGGFTSGDFDKAFELTAADFDSAGLTEAANLCIKGAAYGVNIEDLTITSISIYYCTLDEYASVSFDQAEFDAKVADLDAKIKAALEDVSDLDAATAAADALQSEFEPYFSQMSEFGVEAADEALDKLYDAVSDIKDEATLASLSDYITKVESAYEKAKASPNDASVLQSCLEEAREAADYVVQRGRIHPKVGEKGKELREKVTEIETMLNAIGGAPSGDAATTDAATTTAAAEEKGGCGSSLGTAAVILAVTSVLGCAVIGKKH